MREFERIRVENGQAYIRDTEITVSQVVTQIIHEKNFDKVFAEYSNLDTYDVQEALAYAVGDLRQDIAMWCHEIMVPLTTVKGYGELLSLNFGTEEERKSYLNTVRHKSLLTTDLLVHFNSWTRWKYGNTVQYWQETNLSKLINQILSRSLLKDKVRLEPFDETIQVRENGWLENAIFNLVNEWHFTRIKPGVVLQVLPSKELVLFHIQREFLNESEPQNSEQFFWDGHPFLLSRQILEAHQSSLEVEIIGLSISFKFSLPILKESS